MTNLMHKSKLILGYLHPQKLVMSGSSSAQSALNGSARIISKTHLKTGDPLPDLRAGQPWLFSAQMSPFAQRVRLVLAAKGISYDEINCNLKDKPEFLVERNPVGKVPVLELNGKVTTESLVICELLEDLYPDPPLNPKDPFKKAQDRVIIEVHVEKVQNQMIRAIFQGNKKSIDKIIGGLAYIERDLVGRATPFFGGQQPGMADLMIWPFNERLKAIDQLYDVVKPHFPSLVDYFHRMEATPGVQATANPKERHLKFFIASMARNNQDDPSAKL